MFGKNKIIRTISAKTYVENPGIISLVKPSLISMLNAINITRKLNKKKYLLSTIEDLPLYSITSTSDLKIHFI
jgi:hypothetical protein